MHEVRTKKTDELIKKYRFTVEDYHRMGEANIIAEDERVELIQGEIIEMSPIKSPHAGMVKLLNRLFGNLLRAEYIISVQDPVELTEYSEPEPDLAILKYRSDLYAQSHPKPEDVVLIIEVADTSLDKDRHLKMSLYAAAGIPEYWIINLPEQQIEMFMQPAAQGYSEIHIYRKGDIIQTDLIGKLEVNQIFIL